MTPPPSTFRFSCVLVSYCRIFHSIYESFGSKFEMSFPLKFSGADAKDCTTAKQARAFLPATCS